MCLTKSGGEIRQPYNSSSDTKKMQCVQLRMEQGPCKGLKGPFGRV